MIISRS